MLNRYLANPYREQRFSKYATWYLMFVTVAGALARILYHYNRPFTGDEVGTLIYIGKSVSYLLSHFETWLSMNYFIVLEKIMVHWGGHNQISLTFIPLTAGIATIPLTAILARTVTSTKVALISATLVAANPYLIQFSGIIRAYSLVTALSLIVVILFFRWYANRTLSNGVYVSLACYALVLSHLNGVYVVSYVLLIVSIDILSSWKSGRKLGATTLLAPLAVSVLLMVASYARIYPEMLVWTKTWLDTPPTGIAYVPYVISQYFGDGYYGWLSLALLLSAFLITYKHNAPLLILIPYVVLPVILMSVQGTSYLTISYPRYVIFLVPVCIIFIAEGVQYYASLYAPRANALSMALTLLLLVTWIPNLRQVLESKVDYPWNQVADFINTAAQKHDVVFYRTDAEELNLYPYFSRSRFIHAQASRGTEGELSPSGTKRLFFVRLGPFLASGYPSYAFGKIQVIVYPAASYSDQLLMIRDDLLKNIHVGELSPDIADDYRNIWAINRKLNQDGSSNAKYYELYMFCLRLTFRQRNIPLPAQKAESVNAVNQDILNSAP